MPSIYRNRTIINQRGGSIDINNTTENESIGISHRSGSNITLNNVVNAELATNNKQTNVVNDRYDTTGGDSTEFVSKDKITRVGENSYNINGILSDEQLNAATLWKNTYEPIARLNSKFKIKRGGVSYPNGDEIELSGERANNPVLEKSKIYSVNNVFNGYSGVPLRLSSIDEVVLYSKVPDRGKTVGAQERQLTEDNIATSAGTSGSNAPGVIEFGSSKSAATEGGTWSDDTEAQDIASKIIELQDTLTPIEQAMGNGGDSVITHKRNKFETVGVVFNDFPSVRIDEKGRSQPLEVLVSTTGVFKNHDYVPHVEEIDNSSNFPGGEETKIVSNKYNLNVGSGGINLKTTGSVEFGGTILKMGYKKVNINASHGVTIGSEAQLELQSLKTITLRTNRQVYVDGALGVNNNLIVRGGTYTEGETYLQHVTAPLEVQQTEDTILAGKFATDSNRRLLIGEALVQGQWYPVYAVATDNLIVNYPHSHHFNNLPLRLTKSNLDVRDFAHQENINNHVNISQSLGQNHERKTAKEA